MAESSRSGWAASAGELTVAKPHVKEKLTELRKRKIHELTLSGDFVLHLKKWSTNQKIRHGDTFLGIIKELANEPDAIKKLFEGDPGAVMKKYASMMTGILADTITPENFDSVEEAIEFIGEDLDSEELVVLCRAIWEDNLRPLLEGLGVKLKMPKALADLLATNSSTCPPNSSSPDSESTPSSTTGAEKS